MRSAPFPSLRVLIRVLTKAVLLLVITNVVFLAAGIDPVSRLLTFNTWWLVGHGRARLVYPSDFANGQLPVEALLAAHEIAYTPKARDEYRVVTLGSSGILGWGLEDRETFTAQLNTRRLTINGKRVVAYNLAYPSPQMPREIAILDAAMAYQPDLVIWFAAMETFNNSLALYEVNPAAIDLNYQRLKQRADMSGLTAWLDTRVPPEQAALSWRSWLAIHNENALPVWFATLFYPFNTPSIGRTNRRLAREALPGQAKYRAADFEPMPNEVWQFLPVARGLTDGVGARLLLINQPIFIGSGARSDTLYNQAYTRALYDHYRETLSQYTRDHQIWYADLWNAVPPSYFTDDVLHMDAAGTSLLVERVSALLVGGQIF
jgi:hypothetical protein